jgi:pilus assembly protein CpaC
MNHLGVTLQTHSIFSRLVLVFALLAIAGFGRAAPGSTITLQVGQAHVLQESNIKRIAVGNGRIVQVQALDDKQILLIPEAPGQTSILLWSKDGSERSVLLNVVAGDINRVHLEVQAMLGTQSSLVTRVVGEKILVEGRADSELLAARVAEVSKRFPQVISLVTKVGLERMIAMDVRMIEIKRSLMQDVGIRWNNRGIDGPSFGIVGDLHRSTGLRPGSSGFGSIPGTDRDYVPAFKSFFSLASSITSAINLAVNNGDAVILAEPRLSCRSGGTARFIAGGELPMPVQVGQGQISVQFKEYGVKFEVSPTANEAGVISSRIVTEISSLNEEVKVQGIPGLIKRRAETDVNLRENETLVIAGLLTDESSKAIDKVSGLGDIPILGKLFRSRAFREAQTELVVLITPRFVGGELLPSTEQARPVTPSGQMNRRFDDVRDRIRMVE